MEKEPIYIDTEKGVYKLGEKDIGEYCTGVEIKIGLGNIKPEVILHLKTTPIIKLSDYSFQALIKGIKAEIDDKNPAMVETSDK